MEGEVLRDDQWARLERFVPGGRKGKRGPCSNGRRFQDAVLWVACSGARWRDLPEDRFGPYQTAKRRTIDGSRPVSLIEYSRPSRQIAIWNGSRSTPLVIRANARAASGRRKRGGRKPRLSGARAGGFGSIHAVVDALGLPVRFALGPAQQNDMHRHAT